MKEVHPEISEACSRADEGLWAAFARSRGREAAGSPTGKLLFPEYRGGDLRVSEQEARFAFVEALAAGSLTFSVEAPTSKLYQFTGKSPLSAQTDLAIHDEAGGRICNVEFKAKGVSPSAEKHFPIYKDLQKLMREPLWGLWFHLLEGVDNSTIGNLLSVFETQMDRVRSEHKGDIESPGLTIHICVLQQEFSIERDLPIDDRALDHLLKLELKVSQSELLTVGDTNGWTIKRPAS